MREEAPYQKKKFISEYNFRGEKENWSQVPDGGLIPGETGQMTVGRNII
jgi:hypothetical protein